jgi:hypothetical protein
VAGRISAYNTIKNFTRKINGEEEDLNEFQPDQSLTGNKANAILNEMKLGFILNQKDKPIIGSK